MKIIRVIFEIIEGLLLGILGGMFDGINSFISPKRKTQYSSGFIPATKLLAKANTGFNLTGTLAMTATDSCSNCSVFGPSGSGKSSVIILPTIYSLSRGNSTICVNDPSGEIYEKISGYLAGQGYIIQRIDFSNPEKSEAFNPLARCKTVSDIQKVVHLIIRNTVGDSKGDPFWDRSAEMLITLFGRYLVFYAEPQFRTMANVLRLIETFAIHPQKIDKLFVQSKVDDGLMSSYSAALVTGEKTMQSIISTSRAALNIFSDATIIQTTSQDTIDFARFRTDKVALFICNPINNLHYYKSLSALFFESLFNEIMSRIPNKGERSIFCILEEAATMKFSSISTVISNIRKYNAGVMIAVQDYQALVALYGPAEAHNLRTNTYAQVYLKSQPLETCKELESILGRYSYNDENGTEKNRLLMSADEIRTLKNEAIILCGNQAPIKAKMTPYYEQYKLRKLTQIPPFVPHSSLPNTLPPSIPL